MYIPTMAKKYERLTPILFTLITIVFLFSTYSSASAKDEWTQVRSKNFFLIGNASEKDIRKVGMRLEQFRETFRLLFSGMNLTASIPTNVVVFKSDSYYKNFKPKRSDGKIDNFVAGFFQPGEDVNYITLSTEGDGSGDESTKYSVIFHEYVHHIVNTNFGKSEVPAWFNEGLAEYYETFAIEDDQKVKLGLPQGRHLTLLQQQKLMPLGTLFNISNYQLLQTGDHSRSIFYAESWALIHYLIQSGKSEGLSNFLTALLGDIPPEKAFKDALKTDYAQMEKDLTKYVGKSSYQYQLFTLKNKLTFDADMTASPMDEATFNAYLGDLLYHNNRADDAEPYLLTALKSQPDSSMANTTLGMVKIKQRKFDEAKIYLEKAISQDPKNQAAYYRYAYVLSREGRDEFGFVQKFDPATAAKMRSTLRKAIAINPSFTESYELLAFVDIVNNEELDDAVKQMMTALKYQPGNQAYALRIAELYNRQSKYADAGLIAEKISRTSDDAGIKRRADNLINEIVQRKNVDEHNAAEKKRYETAMAAMGTGAPRLFKSANKATLSPAEIAKIESDARIRSINEAIRNPTAGELRVLGHIQKIECKQRPLVYTVKTGSETFTVTSQDFNALTLNIFDPAADNLAVGCDINFSRLTALLTYRAAASQKSVSRGELVSIEFVPADFRVMTEAEMHAAQIVVEEENESQSTMRPPSQMPLQMPNMPAPADIEAMRKAAMMRQIKDNLRKPAEGQKREAGFLDKIECKGKDEFFIFHTATQTIRLLNPTPSSLQIRAFTPDLDGVQFGCTVKPIEFPAIFIYTDKPDIKAKTGGNIVSLEFVPKSFVLE